MYWNELWDFVKRNIFAIVLIVTLVVAVPWSLIFVLPIAIFLIALLAVVWRIRRAQKQMFDEARRQAEAAFSGNADAMPSVTVKADNATPVVDVMVLAGVATSKSEARRLVEGGGVKLNESKVPAVSTTLGDMNVGNEFVLHKGKKVHLKVTVE